MIKKTPNNHSSLSLLLNQFVRNITTHYHISKWYNMAWFKLALYNSLDQDVNRARPQPPQGFHLQKNRQHRQPTPQQEHPRHRSPREALNRRVPGFLSRTFRTPPVDSDRQSLESAWARPLPPLFRGLGSRNRRRGYHQCWIDRQR